MKHKVYISTSQYMKSIGKSLETQKLVRDLGKKCRVGDYGWLERMFFHGTTEEKLSKLGDSPGTIKGPYNAISDLSAACNMPSYLNPEHHHALIAFDLGKIDQSLVETKDQKNLIFRSIPPYAYRMIRSSEIDIPVGERINYSKNFGQYLGKAVYELLFQ